MQKKSEAIIFSSRQNSTSISYYTDVNLAGSKIAILLKIKSFAGVTLDSSLTFANHISNICQKSNFHIRTLCHIRRCLTEVDAKIVASALVGSQLEYCNSLFFGVSRTSINKLQLIQNTIVFSRCRYLSTSPHNTNSSTAAMATNPISHSLQDSHHYLQDTQDWHSCLPLWTVTAQCLIYQICNPSSATG